MSEEIEMEILEVAKALRDYIDSIPKDTELPTMPGVDRDWVDSVIWRAERGQFIMTSGNYD